MNMTVAEPIDSAVSASWDGPVASVTVVVSSHNRARLLYALLDALEEQDHDDFEVVVADNGSDDDTWSALITKCSRTSLRLCALRLDFHDGPAVPRNTCIAEAGGDLIVFTDDDCLPTPGWLSAITAAFDDHTVLVQGKTIPEPGGWAGSWGRSLTVTSPTGLYETANLAARRDAILVAGGFPSERLLSGRAFGEDVLLGSALARIGGVRFAADAVVHHRVMPGTYRDFLSERRRLAGFPMLLRYVPELRRKAFLRLFLSKRTAITDLALLAVPAYVVIALLTSFSPLAALAGLALLPWFVALWREARGRAGRNRVIRALQLARADVTGAVALLTGTLKARRPLF